MPLEILHRLNLQLCSRAEDPSSRINFQPQIEAAVPVEQRQSVLGCIRGCTRELRVGGVHYVNIVEGWQVWCKISN